MNGLIGLFSLSALLLSVSGQFPDLSPSFSLQGDVVETLNGQVTTGSTIQAIDINRRLQYIFAELTDGEISLTYIGLSSGNDNTLYVGGNGVCNVTTIPSANNPFDTSIWDLYAAGTESPAGTFTYTEGGATLQLTIVNGLPAAFTDTTSTSVTATTVTNFYNTTPAFSRFSLPTECSQFTCTACYSSALSVSISVLLLLTTLLLYLFATL